MKNKKKLFYTEIKQIRQKVNSHLDSLEEQILLELNAAETEIKSKLNTFISQITNKRKCIETMQTNMSALKEYASDLQIFLGSKSLEREVEIENKYLESLFQNGSVHQTEIKCDISKNISDILTTITAFGSVSVGTSQSSIVYKTKMEKQAQILSAERHVPRSIDNISFSLKTKFPIVQPFNIRAIAVSESGLMALVDSFKRLCTMDSKVTFNFITMSHDFSYSDVTFVDDSTIAASLNNAIEIITIHPKKTKRVISIPGECRGLRYYNGKLLCNVISKGILMIQLSNGQITDLVKQKDLEGWSYLAIHDDKIYQTTSNYFVRCYTMNGEKIWQHKLQESDGLARGITVDSNGIVYVAKYKVNSIALLSPDGQRCRHVQIGDTKKLWALHFNAITNSITVASVNGTIELYNVSYSD